MIQHYFTRLLSSSVCELHLKKICKRHEIKGKSCVTCRGLIQYMHHVHTLVHIKMLSYHYRKSHCKDKSILWSSYLHNEISSTGKTSLYWIRAQVLVESCVCLGPPVQDRHNFPQGPGPWFWCEFQTQLLIMFSFPPTRPTQCRLWVVPVPWGLAWISVVTNSDSTLCWSPNPHGVSGLYNNVLLFRGRKKSKSTCQSRVKMPFGPVKIALYTNAMYRKRAKIIIRMRW